MLIIYLSGVTVAAYANEAYMEWSGGALSAFSECDSVLLKSEIVSIIFHKTHYCIDATFTFANTGHRKEITMGFPVSSGGVIFNKKLLTKQRNYFDFKTWIDNNQVDLVKAHRTLSYETTSGKVTITDDKQIDKVRMQFRKPGSSVCPSAIDECVWFTKKVTFEEGESISTRVAYKADYGSSSMPSYILASYIYGSGRSWSGNIGNAKFIIRVSPNVWMVNYPKVDRACQWRRCGEFEYSLELHDFEPSHDDALDFWLSKSLPPYVNAWDVVELETPVTAEILSLCSLKQLNRFKLYADRSVGVILDNGTNARIVQDEASLRKRVEEDTSIVRGYLMNVSQDGFCHKVFVDD